MGIMTLGQTIAKQRRVRRLKQSELASQLGVTQSIIAKWESDKVRPRPQIVDDLAKALGMRVEDLQELDSSAAVVTPGARSRPVLKELLQQLPELADDQLEALRVVVRDMLMRGKMESALKS